MFTGVWIKNTVSVAIFQPKFDKFLKTGYILGLNSVGRTHTFFAIFIEL